MTRGVIMVMMEDFLTVRDMNHMDHYLRLVIQLDAV